MSIGEKPDRPPRGTAHGFYLWADLAGVAAVVVVAVAVAASGIPLDGVVSVIGLLAVFAVVDALVRVYVIGVRRGVARGRRRNSG